MGFILGAILAIGIVPFSVAVLLQSWLGPDVSWTVGFFLFLIALWALRVWTDTRVSTAPHDRSQQPHDPYSPLLF